MNPKDHLVSVIVMNPDVRTVLDRASILNLPNWYVGAGCIPQTYWNKIHGYRLTDHISDIDLVYYDQQDTSYETEAQYIESAQQLFEDIPVQIDLKNQARVHLWYSSKFEKSIEQYASVEQAVSSWPTTATTVAITKMDSKYKVYSAYGLTDLFNLVVRPNKVQVTEEVYSSKANKWKKHWPKLSIIPW